MGSEEQTPGIVWLLFWTYEPRYGLIDAGLPKLSI